MMRDPVHQPPAVRGRRRAAPAGFLLALVVTAALAVAMAVAASGPASQPNAPSGAGAPASPSTSGQAAETPDLHHAEQLFIGTCAACHGLHGQGAGMPGLAFPPLDDSSDAWQKSAVDLELVIKGGKGTMPGVGSSWSEQDIRDVLALLETWWTPEQRAKHDALSKAHTP